MICKSGPLTYSILILNLREKCLVDLKRSYNLDANLVHLCRTCSMLRQLLIAVCFSDGSLGLTRRCYSHVTLHDVSDWSPRKKARKYGDNLFVFWIQR